MQRFYTGFGRNRPEITEKTKAGASRPHTALLGGAEISFPGSIPEVRRWGLEDALPAGNGLWEPARFQQERPKRTTAREGRDYGCGREKRLDSSKGVFLRRNAEG